MSASFVISKIVLYVRTSGQLYKALATDISQPSQTKEGKLLFPARPALKLCSYSDFASTGERCI